MSSLQLITLYSDDQNPRFIRDRIRRLFQWLCSSLFFFRISFNEKDISFSQKEIKIYNDMAHQYNVVQSTYADTENDKTFKFYSLFFQANTAVLHGDSKEGAHCIKEGLNVVKTSQKADLYELLMASPRARVHYMDNDIEDLSSHIHECLQKIDALGRGVPGSILGWLYYMRARTKTNREDKIEDFERAINEFNRCEIHDIYYGIAHCLCRLIICRLGCGERADTIDCCLGPTPPEMQKVKRHFEDLEKIAVTDQSIVIKILYLMARSDYEFRKRNFNEALEFAKEAYWLVVTHKCKEFLQVAEERQTIYSRKYEEMSTDHHGKDSTCKQSNPVQTTIVKPKSVHIGNKYKYKICPSHNQSHIPAATEDLVKEEQYPFTVKPRSDDQLLQEVTKPNSIVNQADTMTEHTSRQSDCNDRETQHSDGLCACSKCCKPRSAISTVVQPATTNPIEEETFPSLDLPEQEDVTTRHASEKYPSSSESILRPLGYNISEKMKSQIRSGDFVDFGLLLFESKSQVNKSDNTLRLEPPHVSSIEKWNEAFRIFVAMYSVEFPTQTPHLMKYSSIINDLATKNGDWQFYDLQFRNSKASGVRCWGELELELYNSALTRNKT